MQMNHAAFAHSPAIRASLKRGLARQAISKAEQIATDLPMLIRMAADLRPNAKGVERLGRRLAGRPGVTRVSVARERTGLTFTARAVREIETRVDNETAFRETSLIYLRAKVGMAGSRLCFELSAVSFCRHALERLVERSDVGLALGLLPQVDIEAQAIFRAWNREARITDAGDEYYPADMPGLWAGGHDEMSVEQDWNLVNDCGQLPIFSARTFLSEAEMRPTVWLRWRDDPACRMS
jgi:hypothetical protein